MKMKTIAKGLVCVAAVALAAPAFAQIVPNGLPPAEGLPGSWTAAAPIFPTPEKWSASVSWAITTPSPGISTYWYKVDHLGGGPLSPPIQPLKSSTLDVDPMYVQVISGVYQFGSYELSPPNVAGQSWGADVVVSGDTSLRWSTQGGIFNTLSSGETIYLWVRSDKPAAMVNLTLQDGTIAQTKVPGPAPVPEPMSMALVGLGLAAIGGLRRKA